VNRRIIGFDFGLKRIGVATGNEVTATAQSLQPIQTKNCEPIWSQIHSVIVEWKPTLLLVGLPLNMDGTEGKICRQARH